MINARKLESMPMAAAASSNLMVLPVGHIVQAVAEEAMLPPAMQRRHRGLSVVGGQQFVADTQAAAERIVQEAEQRMAQRRAARANVFCMKPLTLTRPEPANWSTRLRRLFS
ncbi:hypothetical protein ACFQBQ_10235 [Granulicella cerasi]|uniref:Uncharacterized protein n=1 Tax=Granulicella cerasi TaxID=741063 RepID=A0ABW1Z9U3_9BACT|nr:hypothetical protein [Granulicella cerasi]